MLSFEICRATIQFQKVVEMDGRPRYVVDLKIRKSIYDFGVCILSYR